MEALYVQTGLLEPRVHQYLHTVHTPQRDGQTDRRTAVGAVAASGAIQLFAGEQQPVAVWYVCAGSSYLNKTLSKPWSVHNGDERPAGWHRAEPSDTPSGVTYTA